MHLIDLIHEFHNLSWITEINELFHNIQIYWDAPVCMHVFGCHIVKVDGDFNLLLTILSSYYED